MNRNQQGKFTGGDGYWKGKNLTESTKSKLSQSHKGKTPWNKGLLGYGKGHVVSPEARKKISEGRKGIVFSKDTLQKMRDRRIGKKMSEETKKKISEATKGEKSHLWKGGITPINQQVRVSREYKIWRRAVFERDNFTCVWCKTRGKKLNADHIKRFSDYPELRFAIDNGRTLCESCHKTTDTYGTKNYVKNK